MRILADENVPRPLVVWLRDAGHDMTYWLYAAIRVPSLP